MQTLAGITIAVLLLTAVPGYAQMGSTLSGSQEMGTIVGKITEFDLAHRILALDTGEQFRLPESFEYNSFPAVDDEVGLTYEDPGGQKIVRWIGVEANRDSHSGAQ